MTTMLLLIRMRDEAAFTLKSGPPHTATCHETNMSDCEAQAKGRQGMVSKKPLNATQKL